MPPTLLITRPAADARRLADDLAAQGVQPSVIIAPVLDIVPVAFEAPDADIDLLILTSRHAAPAAQTYAPVSVVCVGEATARVAREAGLLVRAVFPDADTLVADLVAAAMTYAGRRMLHLHGRHTRGRIAERLNSAEIETMEAVVYEQHPCNWDAQQTRDILAAPALIIPLYSPRSARLVAENLANFAGDITLIGLSQACLKAWDGPAPTLELCCTRPDGEVMKQAIASQFA